MRMRGLAAVSAFPAWGCELPHAPGQSAVNAPSPKPAAFSGARLAHPTLPRMPMQHDGRVPAPQRACATMGRPNGCNADPPQTFLRAHIKEPVLPQREAPEGRGVYLHTTRACGQRRMVPS